MFVVLLGIGFLAGVVTAVSPCVLPVLPIVLAGSASGGRHRPYAIIAGLVASFTLFTLVATWLLDQLGLPQDFLRNVAIGLLFLVAATLLFPPLGVLIERPFARLTRRRGGDLGGGFLLGASLGLVFVPCAGPVLTTITVVAATRRVGTETVFLTFAYALGAAAPMLLIAIAGRRATERVKAIRGMLARFRPALGLVIAGAALLIVFNVDRSLQTAVPGYTNAVQRHLEGSAFASRRLGKLTGADRTSSRAPSRAALGPALADYGSAPDFQGISHWLNTPGDQPLSLAALRGKVVLVDFWTYSCINCLRTLPYLEAWYRTYAKDGFVIVGVHTPEFAFEHELGNVRHAVGELGVRYPIALDNDYATWNAYVNQYWPAEYLLDRNGHLREARFGEGDYSHTEDLIRRLLAERHASLPAAVRLPDRTPTGRISPETYIGYERGSYAASTLRADAMARYRLPTSFSTNELALGGSWRIESQRAVAGRNATLGFRFVARKVHLVLGGRGQVEVLVAGRRVRTVAVTEDRLYTLVSLPRIEDRLLELRFSPGVEVYAFTFG